MLISQRHYNKRWKLRLSPKSACFRAKTRPWKTFELRFKLVKWFSLQHQPLCTYLKIHTMRSTIFMINKYIYNHPFKKFMNKKHEGVEDLMCGNVRETTWFRSFWETTWFRSFLTWAWIWWDLHEVASMLVDVIFLFKLQGWFFMNVHRWKHCLHYSMPLTFIGRFIVQNFSWIGDS